jgi:hypothetical protein
MESGEPPGEPPGLGRRIVNPLQKWFDHPPEVLAMALAVKTASSSSTLTRSDRVGVSRDAVQVNVGGWGSRWAV